MNPIMNEPPAEVKQAMDTIISIIRAGTREIENLRAENERLKAEVETLKARNASLHIRLHHAYAGQRDTEPMP